jgi:TP901 family phage tail tape measure protein
VAELQVGIRADVKDGRKVVKTLKDIRQAAGQSNASLKNAAKSAKTASAGYQIASGSALKLAGATDLTSAANTALTTTLNAATASAAREATATKAAAAAQTQLSTATRLSTAAKAGATRAANVLTASMTRLRTIVTGMWQKPTAGLKRFGAQMRTASGTVVGFSAGAAGLGAALAIGIGSGIKASVEFEKTLSRITGLVGIAADEVKAFEKPLLDISKATTKGPNELADALFFITSAGARGKDALDILEASAKAAAAGLGETKQVADAVTSAVNAYGSEALSAAKATDILTKTVREGKAEADSIASSLGRVLPIASNLGVGMDQVGATIAALTRQGLDANEATTSLRASLATLIKPTAEAEETLAALSQQNLGTTLTFGDLREMLATGDKNILEVFELMNDAVGGSGDALVKLVPNIRANAGVFSLLGKNLDDNRKIFESLADAAGTTDDAFKAYKNTTSFELNEALNVLKISLQTIGEKLLPAVAKAFVWLAEAVEKTVDGFTGLGEAIAEAISGSDDPYIRALERQKELNDAVNNLTLGQEIITGFDELGKPIRQRLGELSSGDKVLTAWKNQLTGIAGIDVSGTFDEQLEQLINAKNKQDELVAGIEKEKLQRMRANAALKDTDDLLEEIVVTVTKRPVAPIDNDLALKAQNTLKGLRIEAAVLSQTLVDVAEKGAGGIGLAEDAAAAKDLFSKLQGTVKGLTEEELFELIQQNRRLEEAVNRVTQAVQIQAQAFDFIASVEMDVANLASQFEAISQVGGSLVDIQAAQQAAQIMRDLGDQTSYTEDQIKMLLLEQQAWNAALQAMDPTGLQDVGTFIKVLEAGLPALEEGSEAFQRQANAIQALKDNAIDLTLSELGIGSLVDFTPIEQQFAEGEAKLREAFNIAGIIDPDSDPRFQAALNKLRDKLTGIGDIAAEFGKTAATNLRDAFSDIFFDPFDVNLDDLAYKFGQTLLRLASDLLANQLLLSLLKQLSGFGGGVGAIANAGISALGGGGQGGFAAGGDFVANKPMLVGEKGPEVITPRKSGSVIPNEMLGGQAAAPEVNVAGPTIVNTIEDSQIVAAFNRGGGGQVILNDMAEKKTAYRNALGL